MNAVNMGAECPSRRLQVGITARAGVLGPTGNSYRGWRATSKGEDGGAVESEIEHGKSGSLMTDSVPVLGTERAAA